jgi:hypothetical protein
MKKYLIALVLVLLTASSLLAQDFKTLTLYSETHGKTVDTVTNTGVRIVAIPNTPQYFDAGGIQARVDKISGTGAGVIRAVASYDGVNFFRIIPTDSLNVTNVTTAYKAFVLTSYPYNYVGISYTGSGTMAYKLQGTAWLKRKPVK